MTSSSDTGAALRALYAGDAGVRAIFGSRVAEYVASRPDYPVELFALLTSRCPPAENATVADVGSGTGLLTQGLLRCGYRVIAVEPNAEMRAACDTLLGAGPGYRSVEGGGEAMPLAPASIDLITVAQAFHWFDALRARAEFLRVLTPGGSVALIWNQRALDDPLQAALEAVFAEFGGARRTALTAHEEHADVPRFFGAAPPEEFSWPHAHRVDEAGLTSLVLSRSYMPGRATPEGQAAVARVREVFRAFQHDGTVEMRYRTRAFFGRPA